MNTLPPPPASTVPYTTAPSPAAAKPSVFRRLFGPLFEARTWLESLHLLLDLGAGIAFFTMAVTFLSVSFGLAVTLIGIPLLAISVVSGRLVGVVERMRARLLLGSDFPGFAPFGTEGRWTDRLRAGLTDRPGWKGLAYGLIMLPWGILTFTMTVVLWSVAWSFAVFPTFGWWTTDNATVTWNNHHLGGGQKVLVIAGVGLLGLVLLVLTPWAIRGMATVDRLLIGALLSPGRAAELTQRVAQLSESRDASVESSSIELRRIERDLHDGAQQRLVSLAMDLGLAKERLRTGENSERALELVTKAHDEAKSAIGDLRNLVRGIHPQVLTDRGLDAALSAVTARSPIPVDLQVDLPERPPSAIEAAAYFVVVEALTNVAKHSGAARAGVSINRRGDRLVVEIRDDGHGGAVIHPGGGLAGLRDRVLAVEGRFRLASPPDGPTLLVAEFPCAS